MKYKRNLEMGCTELLVSGCPFPGWKQKKTNTKQNNSNPLPPKKIKTRQTNKKKKKVDTDRGSKICKK